MQDIKGTGECFTTPESATTFGVPQAMEDIGSARCGANHPNERTNDKAGVQVVGGYSVISVGQKFNK